MSSTVVQTLVDNRGTVLVSLCIFLGSWLLMKKLRPSRRNAPPGLPSIPILGSMPWLSTEFTHLNFTDLAKKYGRIYTIDFGRQRAVVLNDYSSIQEALVKKGVVFADRPPYHIAKFINPKQKGIVNTHYGESYIHLKQTSLAIFRDLGLGKNVMEGQILSEVRELLDAFSAKTSEPFETSDIFYMSVSNVICSVLFSKRFSYEDTRFCKAVNDMRDLIKQFGELTIVEFMPLTCYIPWVRRDILNVIRKFGEIMQFIQDELNEHSKYHQGDHDRDFISAFKHREGEDLDPELLRFLVMDFFGAGTDTTSTTLRWALVYMANNPDIQSRVHQEIDEVIGEDRLPSMSDRTSLRFTEAVLLETLRMSSIAPMAIPHRVTSDTELQGFALDKDTLVMINIWAVHHDPAVWPDPDKFDPGRFLDRGEVTGRERIIPFGLGRRSCLGEALARQELLLYFTSIIQRFQVLPPPGVDKLSEEGVFGTVLSPKPHQVILKPRLT